MRRAATLLLVLVLMGLATTALAGWQNYKDKFSSDGYSGNDGSLNWASSWREVGESDGPDSGMVQVTGSGCSGQCLSIEAGLLGLGAGAYRLADTGEFANGQLSYDVAFDGGGLLGLLTGSLTVQATSNGGGSWTTVQTVTLDTDDDDLEHRSVSVSGFLSDDFGVRFLVTGTLGASVIIDNVQVGGDLIPTTTTTTSTTTTTTPSTTTTTASTTTTTTTLITLPPTTLPKLPPTTLPKLPTTSTTTTTIRPNTSSSTTTTTPSDGEDRDTSTTQPSTTTTIAAGTGTGGGGPTDTGDGSGEGSEDGATSQRTSGLLQTPVGLGADIPTDLFGSTAPEVLGFDIVPGFSDAVELIEASWIWVLALALLIAGALVKGIDRRVSPIPAAPDPAE